MTGGVDEIFTRTDTSSTSFLSDGLGSTIALTDATSHVATQYSYEPFGNTSISGTTSGNSFQYTGRENDGIGLYYYRSRYYNPVAQRFISQDPIGFSGSDLNLYGYTRNGPTNATDPTGRIPIGAALPLVEAGPPGWLALAGAALITSPIWAPPLYHALADGFDNSDTGSFPISTPADPNGRKGDDPEPPRKKDPCKSVPQGMLGHYPDYIQAAKSVGSEYFDIGSAWNSLTEEEAFALNQAFLDKIIGQGGAFGLGTPGVGVPGSGIPRPDSGLEWELEYLRQHGYKLGCNGTQMLPPS